MDAVLHKAWDIKMHTLVAGYEGKTVIKGMNAHIPAQKITAVLGESGCGKTTLLKVFLGLIPIQGGSLFIADKDIAKLGEKPFRFMRRRFGVLFQDGALLSSLNLLDNVALPLKEHTKLPQKIITKAVLETLDLVGLKEAAYRYPSELSGGMRKRAGLARAIITEPPLLFYDEPTSGLDPITSMKMDQLLLDMQACYQNMTTILITHDMNSVKRVADHILLVKDGIAHFNGSKEAFLSSDDPYIKTFLEQQESREQKHTLPDNPEVRKALDEWLKS